MEQQSLKLFMLLLGASPPGRHVEQHDVFFGIAGSLKDLLPGIKSFWPEARGLHIDAWREVRCVDGYEVIIDNKVEAAGKEDHLFFINLGGYVAGLFDEPHYKILTVQPDKATAIKYAKSTTFYREMRFPKAPSHIDDKYGVDVDDIYDINEILPPRQKERYVIKMAKNETLAEDQVHLGYLKLNALT